MHSQQQHAGPFVEQKEHTHKENGPSTSSVTTPGHQNKRQSPRKRRQKNNRNSKRHEIRQQFRKAKDLEKKGQWKKAISMLHNILAIDPADAHSHLALAKLEGRRSPDDSTLAVEAFKNGTTACPESVHLWQAWAVYEDSRRGNTDYARKLYERALELDPYNPYVCHAYGLTERKHGNDSAAQCLWERALQRTSTAALVCSLGELLIAKKEYKKVRDLYVSNLVRLKTEREKTEVYLAYAWLEERYFQNFDRAEELIQQSLAASPSSSLAHVALARLEGRRRQKHQGNEVKSATIRRLANACIRAENDDSMTQPADGRVFNAWANIEVRSRRFSAARKILRRGLERYPKDYSLLQAAGKVEEHFRNYTGARTLYSSSLLVEPSAPTLVAYAILELSHPESGYSNFTKVKGLFEEALLIDPRHGPAYNAYARSLIQQKGNLDEARAVFQRGTRANCFDAASIYHGYAKLELSLGNVDKAKKLLVKGLGEAKRHDLGMDSPHRERALFLTHTLGMLELNCNHPSEALEIFSDGIERYGNSSQLLLGAALCEVKLGNEGKTRQLFEMAVLSDEKHAQAWQAWGVMEMRAGNFKTARSLFKRGIEKAPKHGALWHAFAILESRVGDVDKARTLFQSGIRASHHVPLYQSWASLELREEKFGAAKLLITEALTRDKRNGAGWLIAAEIEERLGNSGLVSLILRRGIECSPTDPELYKALGEFLLRRAKINEAREIFEKGIEVDPTHAPLYHSLAELEAQVFNVEGLSKLNKRAQKVFNTNALEPPVSSSEAWGAKIRAERSRSIPRGITALADRIVEEDGIESSSGDPDAFLDSVTSNILEDGLVGQLLTPTKDLLD